MQFSISLPARCAVIFFAGLISASGQNADGNTLQETPGIAIVKPQSWSKESESTVLEFTGYVDRRATANAAAGYYEFRLAGNQKRQVDASKVIKVIVYPDPNKIPNLVEKADRDRIEASLNEIAEMIPRFPATKSYLTPKLTSFVGLFERFDKGDVKVNGEWVPRRLHVEKQALGLVAILKEEISQAQPPGSFDLENDPKFISLRKLGEENPRAKAFADQMLALNSSTTRKEKRREILAKLKSPSLTFENAQPLVVELGNLQPAEDPDATAFLNSWKSGLEALSTLTRSAESLAADFDPQLAPSENSLPEIKAETRVAIADLSEKNGAFLAGAFPPQIKSQNTKAQNVETVTAGFLGLKPLFDAKQFLEAKQLMDGMVPAAPSVGPQSERLLGELQKSAATRVDLFTRTRDEAKALAEASKKPEAIAKYEEAFAIIPDPAVARLIEELKSPAP
jgi:hypothetical protein